MFVEVNEMKFRIYPKEELLNTWAADERQYQDPGKPNPTCLRCGGPLSVPFAVNAVSRALPVYVCEHCGTAEAMEDFTGIHLRFGDWSAAKEGRLLPSDDASAVVLTSDCMFPAVWNGPMKTLVPGGKPLPVSELLYFKSAFVDKAWNTDCVLCEPDCSDVELLRTAGAIQAAIMAMPEFKNLRTLKRMCNHCTAPVASGDYADLYGETEQFYLRLEIGFQPDAVNLFTHLIRKSSKGAAPDDTKS